LFEARTINRDFAGVSAGFRSGPSGLAVWTAVSSSSAGNGRGAGRDGLAACTGGAISASSSGVAATSVASGIDTDGVAATGAAATGRSPDTNPSNRAMACSGIAIA